jgi:hypothetical protein
MNKNEQNQEQVMSPTKNLGLGRRTLGTTKKNNVSQVVIDKSPVNSPTS